MRIRIQNKNQCCGCTACQSVCSHGALSMQPDEMGFFYPVVDDERCVDCGRCVSVCRFQGHGLRSREGYYDPPLVYGGRNKELAVLAKSQSGAAAYTITKKFVKSGGVAYGVVFSDDFTARHRRAVTEKEAEAFRGSKYVQSDLRGIFAQVKEDLSCGIKVLFTGTPCQVAGLKSSVPQRLQEGLFTIDLVCHATCSPKVWSEYLRYIRGKYGEDILAVDFRNKKFGWRSHVETFFLSGKEVDRITFRLLFYDNFIVRPSCASCPYANMHRVSDLSLGDFWGWQEHYSHWNDNKGISLFLVNTDKGQQLKTSVSDACLLVDSKPKYCLQPQLQGPVSLNPRYEAFVSDFLTKGFEYCGKKYADMGLHYKMQRALAWIKYYSGCDKAISIFRRLTGNKTSDL